jgi:hypothetical protein
MRLAAEKKYAFAFEGVPYFRGHINSSQALTDFFSRFYNFFEAFSLTP